MAKRRMFSSAIVLSDAFLDMPASARCLYFTFGMVADDDGFVNNPRSVMRQIGASDDDAKILLAKRYILSFDSGVICLKHWRINNYIQRDRYTPTTYVEERDALTFDEKGAYTEKDGMYTNCIQNGYTGKVRIGKSKVSIGESENAHARAGNPTPTLEEVKAYCTEAGLDAMDPEKFYDHYAAKGWAINGDAIVDWKARARKWNREDTEKNQPKQSELDRIWEKVTHDKGGV